LTRKRGTHCTIISHHWLEGYHFFPYRHDAIYSAKPCLSSTHLQCPSSWESSGECPQSLSYCPGSLPENYSAFKALCSLLYLLVNVTQLFICFPGLEVWLK
jgi:hypothetical protein